MSRAISGLLCFCLLALAPPTIWAQEPSPDQSGTGPVVVGGRIEVPGAGISVAFPEGWYGFDLTHPDLVEVMESFDETTTLLVPMIEDLSLNRILPEAAAEYPGLTVALIAFEPLTGPDWAETCLLMIEPTLHDSVDRMVEDTLPRLREDLRIDGEIVRTFVDLAVGRTGVLEFHEPDSYADETTEFLFLDGDRAYTFLCADTDRRADRWLSIAETIEFLQEEEVADSTFSPAGKPLATVDGTEITRGQWEDRKRLRDFRLERAETRVRAGLVDGSVDEDLADRRLDSITAQRVAPSSVAMEELVDLTFQSQLAAERGISLSEDELAAAIAADGAAPEARRISALIIVSPEEEIGLPPTPEGRAKARADAEAAAAELAAGADIAALAEEYSPATASSDGDLGFVSREDLTDAALAEALFALEEGASTGMVEGQGGEFLIVQVAEIVPEQPDPGFVAAVNDAVGEEVHRRNVELEALAAKLEEQVVADAVDAELEQVRLAQILVQGDLFADPETDEGDIRASHILYAPAGPGQGVVDDDDPAWMEAEQEADLAARQLRAVDDPEIRAAAFAKRAQRESDGPTGRNGGDLGFFTREDMVPEFASPLFDGEDLEFGDIIGPVRSQFGWHVIMFSEMRAPLADRLAEVEAALAADGADFVTVAADYSDGPEALRGGETGWHIVDELDELTALALSAVSVGEVTEAVEGDAGWYIYLKQDEATRPLETLDRARLAQDAFVDWYEDLRFEAEDEGRIVIDDSVYEEYGSGQALPPIELLDVPVPAEELRDGRSLGDPEATVRVDVYEDPQCPACGLFTERIEPLLIAGPVTAGEVYFTYKDMAFLGPESFDAAAAMRVAEELDGKFWDYHQVLFHNQFGENDGAFTIDRLADMAELVGLDRYEFLAKLDDPSYLAAVEAETQEGRELGVNSVPTLIVNGEIIRGAPTWEDLSAQIENALLKARTVAGASAPPGGDAEDP